LSKAILNNGWSFNLVSENQLYEEALEVDLGIHKGDHTFL